MLALQGMDAGLGCLRGHYSATRQNWHCATKGHFLLMAAARSDSPECHWLGPSA
jgi:hypothetical protein